MVSRTRGLLPSLTRGHRSDGEGRSLADKQGSRPVETSRVNYEKLPGPSMRPGHGVVVDVGTENVKLPDASHELPAQDPFREGFPASPAG